MGRDFVEEMLKAQTIEEKVEIYLLAEAVIPEEGLEELVYSSRSKEVKDIYAEKIAQEKALVGRGYVIPANKSETVIKNATTHEKWNKG